MAIQLRKVTISEAVIESLKERIRNREFGPGCQLPSEQTLLKEYGVSRLTLREALAGLSALGVVRVQQGKGAFITESISISALDDVLIPFHPHNDADRMKDLIEARSLIESEVASMAAKKRTKDQLSHLSGLLRCDAYILNDPVKFAERDYSFHLALVKITDNQFFIAIYQALYRQIRDFLIRYAQSIDDRAAAMKRHKPILKAIADGDPDGARKLSREHAGICASFIKAI